MLITLAVILYTSMSQLICLLILDAIYVLRLSRSKYIELNIKIGIPTFTLKVTILSMNDTGL